MGERLTRKPLPQAPQHDGKSVLGELVVAEQGSRIFEKPAEPRAGSIAPNLKGAPQSSKFTEKTASVSEHGDR
ncbi:MAG: hypothetical protein OXI95_20040 [bacterium]|nr:hypothetical protein [bacterium]MDE0419204.1 hypothetical protein [bacterium]